MNDMTMKQISYTHAGREADSAMPECVTQVKAACISIQNMNCSEDLLLVSKQAGFVLFFTRMSSGVKK